MKKLLAAGLVLALSGCGGGYDDMDAARAGMGGIGSTVTKPTTPNNPNEKPNWQYSSVAEGNRVFSLSATTYSINTYQRPDYPNLQGRPFVKLEKNQNREGVITNDVAIFTDSNVSCMPSCDVRMSFDGQWATYQMRHVIDGVIRPINESTSNSLFKKFTNSNRATVNLPIIGLSEPFGANFDLSGYDMKQMKFISE